MAMRKAIPDGKHNSQPHRRTSIGRSANSRVIHKSKAQSRSKYRGQGK